MPAQNSRHTNLAILKYARGVPKEESHFHSLISAFNMGYLYVFKLIKF